MVNSNKKFNVGCWGLVIKDDKEVLLVINKNRYYWEAPGGKVEVEEMIEDAVIREIKEETNINVKIIKNIEVYQYYQKEKKVHWISLGYLAKYLSGKYKNLEPDKIKEIQWFSLKNIPHNINPNTKQALENYKKSK